MGPGVEVGSGCVVGATVNVGVEDAAILRDRSVLVVLSADDTCGKFVVTGASDNLERNRVEADAYREALSNTGKKYFIGKHHKLRSAASATGAT